MKTPMLTTPESLERAISIAYGNPRKLADRERGNVLKQWFTRERAPLKSGGSEHRTALNHA